MTTLCNAGLIFINRVPPPPPPEEDPPVEGTEGEGGNDVGEDLQQQEGEDAFLPTPLPETSSEEVGAEAATESANGEEEPEEPGMWEETFKTHHDSKPYGLCGWVGGGEVGRGRT